MFIKQVSVFEENKPGSLLNITKLLGDNNIDISALSIADTADYGILRLIVDKPSKAVEVLKKNNYVVKSQDVIAIYIDNNPGALTKPLALLKEANVNIEYLYAFVSHTGDGASVMFKVSDPEKASQVFKNSDIKLINAEDIQK